MVKNKDYPPHKKKKKNCFLKIRKNLEAANNNE